jgi:hypothetical protein
MEHITSNSQSKETSFRRAEKLEWHTPQLRKAAIHVRTLFSEGEVGDGDGFEESSQLVPMS